MNLDGRLMNPSSPLAREQQRQTTFDFTSIPKVDIRRVKTSSTSVNNLIQISDTASASGTLGTGDSVTVDVTLTPTNTFNGARIFGLPYIAIFNGTAAVGSMQLFPHYGSGIDVTEWDIHGGYDYGEFSGTQENFAVNVANLGAGATDVYIEAVWKYISERGGTATGA